MSSAKERCGKAEVELNALREEQAARTQWLEQQEEDLKAREAMLADRDAKLAQAIPTKPWSGTTKAS